MANKDEFKEMHKKVIGRESEEEETEEEEEGGSNEDWDDWKEDDELEGSDSNFLCLFCDSKYSSCDEFLGHCRCTHKFDFEGIQKQLNLDFYSSFKLINYVRSQVAENRCWSCRTTCKSNKDLQNHLHETGNLKDLELLWDDDKFLKPFLQDDSLLYSFTHEEEGEDDFTASVDKEEIMRDLVNIEQICLEDDTSRHNSASSSDKFEGNGLKEDASISKGLLNLVAKDKKKVNENYFGSYSSFSIHREMLSDKVRTDAYRQALLKNPSLLTSAIVMDVGCGTGIPSLFAAKGGASRVIAVEASDKMAEVATSVAKENGLLHNTTKSGSNQCTGVINVVQSMLSSVLFARDKWLKPGVAILPDTATIYVSGFGRGGTSLPFWEDVYGFNMSCIGKELVHDAAHFPIVDVVNGSDLVTDAALLQAFDLATMKPEEVDFTASCMLEPNSTKSTWCYGVVLWFDTEFTDRFCKENPVTLSTSPYTPKTHWSQTILTFQEPIAIARAELPADRSEAVGTEACPAARIHLCISIVRAAQHRSIDISMETVGIGSDG